MSQESRALALYIAHRGELVNYANGILGDQGRAEDVVQEAWVRYNAASATRFFEEPVGYLYRIVRNLAVDGRRRLNLEERYNGGDVAEVADQIPEDRPSPETALIARSELDLMKIAISELPERTRIAMEMHRFGGCKLREIADHLGISVTRAHALVMEGLGYCRQRLNPPE